MDESEKILPDEVLTMWTQFKQKNGASWKIEYDSNLGIPTTLDGGQSKVDNRIASLHEEISRINIELLKERAEKFFSENEALLQVKSKKLKFLHQRTIRKTKKRLVFYQEYEGIPVKLSEVNIDINAKGQVIFYRARYFKDIPPINTVPSISQQEAEAIVTDIYKKQIKYEGDMRIKSRLVILPNIPSKKFYLTWEVKINSDAKDLPMAYYVEAISGQIVYEYPEFFRSESRTLKKEDSTSAQTVEQLPKLIIVGDNSTKMEISSESESSQPTKDFIPSKSTPSSEPISKEIQNSKYNSKDVDQQSIPSPVVKTTNEEGNR